MESETIEIRNHKLNSCDFDYKLNHGDTVFKNSKSFISGSLVSSSHGKITSCSENTLVDSSIGWWHTSKHYGL